MNKKVVLDSGIELVMMNTNKFKTVNVTVFFEDELSDFNITCDNLLIKLLTAKTNKYPSRKEFKSYLKELYDMKVNCFKDTPGDRFLFSFNTDALNKKYTIDNENLLEKQFEVLNEMLCNPLINGDRFDDAYFKESKTFYKQILVDRENYKENIVAKRINGILGKDNKTFVLVNGYIDVLDNISNEDVYSKYLNLKSMCKKIIVCGEIDFDEVEGYANRYLNFEPSRVNYNNLYRNDMKKYDDYSFESKFNQSSIGVLYDLDVYVGDPLYYPACVFMEMFNHYLFKIVREEHNFCYSIYISYVASRGIGYLQSNIEEKNYEMTLKLINDIIVDLRNNVDEKILNICKDKVINGIRKEIDNPIKMTIKECQKGMYNLKTLEQIIEICKAVNGDQIKEVANKIEKKFSVILKEGQ